MLDSAQLRLPDGTRPQRRLGQAWLKRSRPPSGYITRAQAQSRLKAILAGDDHSVQVVPPSGATFENAAEEWLRYTEHDRKRERSTVLGYRRAVTHRLLPTFGDRPLEAITPGIAEEWRSGMIAEGLSAPTVNMLRWMGESIYRRAQRVWEGIGHNPFSGLERVPHRPSAEFNILSPEEIAALVRNAANDQDAALYATAAYAGLRLGELRGLIWADLDFADRLIHVRRGFVRGQVKAPKSGKVRSVPMVDQLIPHLDRLSRRPYFTGPDDLVFVNAVGRPVEESALRRRFWKALDRAGLERLRLHDLRHSYGSLAVRAYRLDEVKAYMGHADLAMTMRYVHHVPAHDAAQRLSAVLADGQAPPGAHSVHSDESATEPAAEISFNLRDSGCRRQDSNLRHADYDSAALTT